MNPDLLSLSPLHRQAERRHTPLRLHETPRHRGTESESAESSVEHARIPVQLVITTVLAVLIVAGAGRAVVLAQGRGAAQALLVPRVAAPIDLTGYWVSVVSEDWRFRMVTPLKGDYGGVPLTPEGRRVADTWDLSKDGSCLAYGAAGLMRMPLRVHITWESAAVLKLETDAGGQIRRLLFDKAQQPGPRSLQGFSVAAWEFGPGTSPTRGGSLKVTTTNMTGGWVRRNGVPYSENAVVTEYWDQFRGPTDGQWFSVATFVDDPKYFQRPYVTSSHFKREPNGSKWRPAPCKAAT